MEVCEIKSIKFRSLEQTYNITMKSEQHNYAVYGKDKDKFLITKNSHAVAYTYISSRLLYLKSHFPLEFFVTTLSLEADEDKLKSYKREAERLGIVINRCDLNRSRSNYSIVGNEIYV